MDGKKQMGSSSSSSSFTTDLFGSTESSALSSSSGIFGSIFAPSSKVFGRESLRSEAVGMKQDSANQVWNPKTGSQEKTPQSSGGEYQSVPNKDSNPYYQEQRVQPCHLSSSIYYGGQDVYSHPQKTQASGYSTVNNEGGEDDLGSASRGNWWQGRILCLFQMVSILLRANHLRHVNLPYIILRK
ncbi:hypothetical protein RHGRI_011785 [Rhododendron griersonianum]|uniref:Uncharacterized protein n=1 Tax=Rhododendron griersonianum TaxID=479676 RepID=A0AAV6KN50_9ERIC|nr:hypothetical protein RHGRI_011785 [Rhododendron griersonianum]